MSTQLHGIFRTRLRHLLAERGWTHAELAQRTGMHRVYVSLLLSGKRNPALNTLEQIANAFGIEATDLLTPAAPADNGI